MTTSTPTPASFRDYFRTTRAVPEQAAEWKGADRNRNIIFGAKLIQKGRLNDYDSRPWEVDDETLAQTVKHGSKRNKGLKARFSHPSMSDDGLGTFVGYWKNLRISGEGEAGAVFADLYLSDSSFDTPKGDLGSYLLDLAEEDPEAFGVSVSTKLSPEMDNMNDKDEDGEILPLPLRFADVRAADFVDEPAATRGGLFETDFSDVRDLAPTLDWIINRHFSQLSPVDLLEKTRRYLVKKFGAFEMTTQQTPPVDDVTPDDLETVTPPPVAEPEPVSDTPQPEGFSQAEIDRFRAAFGHDLGATLLCDGMTFDEAGQFYRESQAARIEDLTKQVEDLKEQLAAVMGENEPVPTGTPAGEETGTTLRQQIRHK